MKIQTIALAIALSATSSMVLAQLTGNGAGLSGPAGTGAAAGSGETAGTMGSPSADKTTGMSSSRQATPGLEPGARDKSRPGGNGVNNRPAGQ
jgi:hypothetical protein